MFICLMLTWLFGILKGRKTNVLIGTDDQPKATWPLGYVAQGLKKDSWHFLSYTQTFEGVSFLVPILPATDHSEINFECKI